MSERDSGGQIIQSALEYFKDRNVVAASSASGIVYVEPLPLTVEEVDQRDSDGLENMWAGLQWYKAHCTEALGTLDENERVNLMLEIFDDENLMTLAKFAELQTGTKGVVKAMLQSFEWADWQIEPRGINLTEQIYSIPHVDIQVKLGTAESELAVVSNRFVESDQESGQIKASIPQLHIFQNGREWEYDYEHDALPEFDLRCIEILSNRSIRFEGVPWEDDDWMGDEVHRDFLSYILSEDGSFGGEVREKLDRKRALKLDLERVQGLVDFIPDPDSFDPTVVNELLGRTPMSRKALARFLLPYCDAPLEGVVYMLPEE